LITARKGENTKYVILKSLILTYFFSCLSRTRTHLTTRAALVQSNKFKLSKTKYFIVAVRSVVCLRMWYMVLNFYFALQSVQRYYPHRQGVDISVTACVCLFLSVRTVTDFSAENKASGGSPAFMAGNLTFGETWLSQKPKIGRRIGQHAH